MKKGCIIALIIVATIIIGFVILVIVLANTIGKNIEAETQPNHTTSDNPTIQLIIDSTDMTLENATEVYDAFKAICGSKHEIHSVTHDELLDDLAVEGCKGYRIKTDFSNNVILNTLNGEIYSIRYADNDYYLDGQIQGYIYE